MPDANLCQRRYGWMLPVLAGLSARATFTGRTTPCILTCEPKGVVPDAFQAYFAGRVGYSIW